MGSKEVKQPGRPKAEPTRPIMIRIRVIDIPDYLEMGGARYVKRMIKEYQEHKAGKKDIK